MAEAVQINENSPQRTADTADADAAGADAADQPTHSEPTPAHSTPGHSTAAVHVSAPAGLSERDQRVLALERQWWKYAGAKEQAIRELFDMSATHYYQILNALIDTQEALAHDPMLVKRLRRLRTSRQRARTARRLGN